MDRTSYREFRNGAMLLIAMADFWKSESATDKQRILDCKGYREAFVSYLLDKAAQNAVWKAGYDFFHGGLHGYNV